MGVATGATWSEPSHPMTEPDVLLGSPWLSHDWGVQDGSIFLHLDDAVDVWVSPRDWTKAKMDIKMTHVRENSRARGMC